MIRPSSSNPLSVATSVMLAGLLLLVAVPASAADPVYHSPMALVADAGGKTLYVAESTANQVTEIDTASGAVRRTIVVPDPPSGLALATDGKILYVAGSAPKGRIHVIDLASGKVTASLPVGHTPLSPVLSPDGKRLYVCNQFNNEIAVLDCASGKVTARIPVIREPMAAAITPDGAHLVVANHLPNARANADNVAASVSLIDTATGKATAIELPNGATSLEGACVSPDGAHGYVTHILARYQQPTTQLERGWMNTNAMSIIDIKAGKLLATVLLDSVDLGAANPWGVVCSADGAQICIAHAGTHEVSIIDRKAMLKKIAAAPSTDAVADDLAFLVDVRRRVRLGGLGPRGITLANDKAYVAEYFSDSIGVVDLRNPTAGAAPSWPLGPKQPVSQLRLGELAFHDATRCFQHWQSCASCHPGNARTDGLNWDLMNDGLGNPKNTRSMLLSHLTPPVMSLGVRDCAETAVRAGFRFIQFTVPEEEVCKAVDAFLKDLKPVPSPWLIDGRLSPQQEQGKALFTSAGCVVCHKPPLYTNLKLYDVGTTTEGMDKGKEMDTPALIEVWRTAPYLHDGRAKTLQEVFSKEGNPEQAHGKAHKLSPAELEALIAYVLTL